MEVLEKKKRGFLPEIIDFSNWNNLKKYFEELKTRSFNSEKELEKYLKDISEVEAVLEEEKAWRYIKMTIDTTKPELEKAFNDFVNEISPNAAPYWHEFNKKIVDSQYLEELDKEKYEIYIKKIKMAIKLYRKENIPLITKLEKESQKYRGIAGKMNVEYEGKKLTMEQASKLLKDLNRKIREEIYKKVWNRRKEDEESLNKLYTELIELRERVAKNASHKNYRDYMFDALGRFDYKPKDCFEFHESIESEVLPLIEEFNNERKTKLGIDNLKPWDLAVDIEGKKPLKPFNDGAELLEKSIKCFEGIDPYFGERLKIMKEMKYLDLESKKGKAPGGYNYPLYEIGVPFIFMNAVGLHRDLETLMHEGGHAIHSFLTRDLELVEFKSLPSEVAELASMSMELISMDKWSEFYNDSELKRAKKEQLIGALETLPWVATVDSFQHWIYENPKHSVEMRERKWMEIRKRFGSKVINWEGMEKWRGMTWQRQLHIFEVPFYYIEYAIAQLGAIAIYKNYKENPKKAIEQYIEALKLGYTKSIPEIYKTAGIKFDFSKKYIKELVEFVRQEIEALS